MGFIADRPFKGNWYYEWQVLCLVFMWLHDMEHTPTSNRGLRIGRFYVWYDTQWKMHMFRAPIWLRRRKRKLRRG